MHDRIEQQVAVMVVDDLVDLDYPSAGLVLCDADRLYFGVENRPLARPVVTNSFHAIDEATLHPVRPNDIRMHAGQHVVQSTRVEFAIGGVKQFARGRHLFRQWYSLPFGSYSGWSGVMRQ